MSKVAEMLFGDEGYSEKPYPDSLGYPSVAIGIRIGPKGANMANYQFSVPKPVALLWCSEHASGVEAQLSSSAALRGVWASLSQPRKDALINMGYQLGAAGSTQGIWQFKKMLAAIRAQDWQEAAKEGKDSLWYRQTTNRAERVLSVLLRGDYKAYEGQPGWQQ